MGLNYVWSGIKNWVMTKICAGLVLSCPNLAVVVPLIIMIV